jgi:PAS domain S-box-containing protein
MIFKFNMFGIFKKSGAEFQPYYERENDFKRQAFLHAIAALVVSPIFCLLVYNSEVPRVYILISLSYTVMFPLYIVICYFIKKLTDKLLYFFISHLFFVTFLAFQDLISSNFELFSLFCFYTLYSVVLYVIQRLYPAILYNSFVLFLLIYGFQYNDKSEISKLAVFGLFSIIACCSIIVLSSRQKMINSVEDYSNYLKKIVNNPGVGFVLLKFETNIQKLIDQNRESYKILDCEQNTIKEVVLSHLTDFEKNIIFTLKIGNSFNKKIVLPGKYPKTIEFEVTTLSLKNGFYSLFRIVDITNSVIEKQELSNSLAKYRNLYYTNLAGVFTTDLDSKIIDCNQSFIDIFENSIKINDSLFSKNVQKEWKEILELIGVNENIKNYQTHIKIKNGTTKWLIFNWHLNKEENFIEGTIIDISDVQKASAALSQNEEKYRLIYEESNDAILLLKDDKIIDVNRKGIQLFGIPYKELLEKNLIDLSLLNDEINRREYIKNTDLLQSLKSVKFNWIFKGNNDIIEAEVVIIELMLENIKYYQCVIHDLTQRNINTRAIESNRKNFKSILDNTPEGIIIINDNTVLYSNPEAINLIGSNQIELENIFIKKDQQQFNLLINDQKTAKEIKHNQFKLLNKNSQELLIDVTIVSIDFEEKESILVILKDVSLRNELSKEIIRAEIAEESNKRLEKEIKVRIKTEKLLKEQFIRSNAIFDSSSNTLLLTLDTDLKFSSFNTHCQNYFNYLTQQKMEVNTSFSVFFKTLFEERELRFFRKMLKNVMSGDSKQIETKFSSKANERWIELFINPIFDIEGKVIEISLVAHDITDKKNTENQIKDSLKEKEVLLKEIHHRVKNNLQVISSILNLQSSFVSDERTLEILEESRNRIHSMATIHENLYLTTNFSSIDFASYLQNLTTKLISSYHITPITINLRTELTSINLLLDQAIPCGLLVNELITNAIKYAFINRSEGEIFIGLKENQGIIELKIEDNGVGLPSNFEIFKSNSLGLQLVSTLVEQLDGEIKILNEKGTKYLITFEKDKQ